MKLTYSDQILYIDLNKKLNNRDINRLQNKVHKIMSDYEIEKISIKRTNENIDFDLYNETFTQNKNNNLKIN